MEGGKWEQVKEVFDQALRLAPGEREQFLEENCNGDDELRREVESLLASFDGVSDFLQKPAIGEVADVVVGKNTRIAVGQIISHYEIIEKIGTGGMGEVYLVKDTNLNRKVALKLLASHIIEDESRVSRFRQEAFAASALNHPNIVTIYEIGKWQDKDFIATEFIEGMTLRSLLGKKKLSIGEALDIALQIASALAAAHGAGVVHRDIKPENIMIRADGLVKVLDFGIAKYRPTEKGQKALIETEVGEIIGTAAYMSPEQARGLEVDERTDVWSLGVIFYEMIAGKSPFLGETKSDRIAAILEREPQPLNKTRRSVTPELERIVNRSLAKDKEKRYREMAEMAEEMRRLRETTGDKSSSPFILPVGKTAAPRRFSYFALFIALIVGVFGFGFYFWSAGKPASVTSDKRSLAILPFVNVSQDPNAEYLSDGITESIINNLSQLSDLKVMSRNSAFRFKDKQTDSRAIAAQLGVETLVTGDIRQIGDKFVINVRLIDAADDSQIWGSQFVKTNADIITAQNEIARAVANNLRLKLSDTEQQRLNKNYTQNAAAHQHYLKGRFYWNKRTAENIKKAVREFQQAVEIDPNYALAYVGLADSYVVMEEYAGMPSSETLPRAKAYAMRALEIDEELAEARASLGCINSHLWQWAEAEKEFKRAIELNPNYPTAHFWYCTYLRTVGRNDEALKAIKLAQELDPLSPAINVSLATAYANAGDTPAAAEQLEKYLDVEPRSWLAHHIFGLVFLKEGRIEEAVEKLRQASRLDPKSTRVRGDLGYALALSGRRGEALSIAKELEEKHAERETLGMHVASVYAGLGDKDQAFRWLEKDFRARTGYLPFIVWRTTYQTLRDDPRYADLLRRMNLPQ